MGRLLLTAGVDPMIVFGCDWCKRIKKPGEEWILGMAAESIGVTAARREVTILPTWNGAQACDRLAVHFCSVEDKDKYMAAMFETEPLPVESSISTKSQIGDKRAQREYRRTVSSKPVAAAKKKSEKGRRAA